MSRPNIKLETDEIDQLREELRLLKIDHETVKNRIISVENKINNIANRKAKSTKTTPRDGRVTLEDCRLLAGKKVKILNPKNIEEINSTILKVGTLYVTIVLPNGKHLRRIAKNIRIIEDDE